MLSQPSGDEYLPDALALSAAFNIPMASQMASQMASESSHGNSWVLKLGPDSLQLVRPDGLATHIAFLQGKAVQRSRESNFASQPLARALGLQKLRQNDKTQNTTPKLIDATAGYGTDGWMMASLGCEVRLVEASPILSAMLDHALRKARPNDVANRVSLINANAITYLNNKDNAAADIVYLDPMYPQTRSSALVKKGMQLLHDLVGPDNNGEALLTAALSCATYRVIVKRPKGATQLDGSEYWRGQITQVSSAQTRFDVYHIPAVKPA